VVLDSYSLLFVPSVTAPALGDGDWSSATSYSFPTGASIAVRARAAGRTRTSGRPHRRGVRNRAVQRCNTRMRTRALACPKTETSTQLRACAFRCAPTASRAARSWRAARR
jgi:hypothetical protein